MFNLLVKWSWLRPNPGLRLVDPAPWGENSSEGIWKIMDNVPGKSWNINVLHSWHQFALCCIDGGTQNLVLSDSLFCSKKHAKTIVGEGKSSHDVRKFTSLKPQISDVHRQSLVILDLLLLATLGITPLRTIANNHRILWDLPSRCWWNETMLQFTQLYILYLVHIGIVFWLANVACIVYVSCGWKNILEQKYVSNSKQASVSNSKYQQHIHTSNMHI